MSGDLECPRGCSIQVGVNWVSGVGCIVGEPSHWRCGGFGDVLVLFLCGSLLILYLWIVGLPLGRDRTMSSGSHAAFHVTWKRISRMGMSSSSGCMRARCSGVRPLWLC